MDPFPNPTHCPAGWCMAGMTPAAPGTPCPGWVQVKASKLGPDIFKKLFKIFSSKKNEDTQKSFKEF
jgi:hypothetical protein